ncbi:hypothetical protein GCM10010869_15800 [Mesorhizobium tianshanense]|uniref:Dolichyl-phosphate-mannose-protein mannosyltransferase n=1 Tax=Mesorhizobium tianshanense TaxID=39844 RepID=A0A562NWC7_9HYPH|nr:hypothetical protein [Mesorhizobium tianshanense]TWI36469.1 hypothetical protein IQ26_02982 [Mesorhizobium tianshanense]GLS35991.1 hypothetical protein GCM10010869_15800 [Mesorhizobium tianshanense]
MLQIQASHEAAPLIDDNRRARLVFCLVAATVMAAALLALAASLLQDPDSWWHIKVGQDLLASRTFPTADTYSYTSAGHPWIAKEWLGQVLLALAYKTAGWNGVALLTIAVVALAVFLMSWHLSAWLKPTLAVGLTLVLALLVDPVYIARPHIFTLPIIVVWTAYLFGVARSELAPPLWLLPLLCLWANLHATFTFGFVIAAFAGLDLLMRIRLSNPRLLASWIAFGLLCPLVSLLNPYGVKAILATFTVAYGNEAVPYILEWRPFNASEHGFQEVALLAVLFGLLVSRLQIGWAKALFLVFTLHVYLTHIRFMYLFFLLVPIVLATEVAEQYPALSLAKWMADKRDGLERFFAKWFYQICGVVGVLVVGAIAVLTSAYQAEPSQKTSARDALTFAESHHLSGNVLNSYNFGGSLIFHGIKTFIDGRTDQLFLNGFTKTDTEMGRSGGKPILQEQLKKYAIDWALLTADDSRIPFFDELGWKRAYSDKYAVIYVPGA